MFECFWNYFREHLLLEPGNGRNLKLGWAKIVDQLLVEVDLGFLTFEIRQGCSESGKR